ncbi:ACT domain-containing protein, partial [Alphaproteobacteria bacterium]|nr:ACT domain-containing protein [Alphaproteobacteria bacterium]
ESTLGRYMLYITNKDQPGLIGAVGSRMAESGINIANFHLGRLAQGGDAIAFLEIDSAVSDEDLNILQSLPQIDRCTFLEFPEMSEA